MPTKLKSDLHINFIGCSVVVNYDQYSVCFAISAFYSAVAAAQYLQNLLQILSVKYLLGEHYLWIRLWVLFTDTLLMYIQSKAICCHMSRNL